MKLSEQLRTEHERMGQAIERQLKALALTELASVLTRAPGQVGTPADDRGADVIYMATDQGIAITTSAQDENDDWAVESELTPWSEVSGAHILVAGYQHANDWMITLHVAIPKIELKGRLHPERQSAIREFGDVCMRQQRGFLSR